MSAMEMQIGQDILRYVNIMNDLMDVASMHMKELAEDSGEKYQVAESGGTPMEPTITRDATFDELNARVKQDCLNAKSYKVAIINFMSSLDEATLATSLGKFGETPESVNSAVLNMAQACNTVLSKITGIKDKAGLRALAVDIDSKVPPLKLIRRTWCLVK